MSHKLQVGIVGATGAVGQELIRLLHEREFPLGSLTLLASSRSAGREINWSGKTWTIREAQPEAFDGLDLVIFSAGGGISRDLGPEAVKRGCIVVDNSSVFRMNPEVPLVIPEINAKVLEGSKPDIVANPNCSTAVALMGLFPLHEAFGLKRFFVATYQAVSGTGAAAIHELEEQTRALLNGEEYEPEVYPHPIAFNLLPHVEAFLEDGYTREEMKMLNEARRILDHPGLRVSCTCVRVPVMRAHSMAINAEFEKPVSVEAAHEVIKAFSGVELRDDPDNLIYPMPIDYTEKVPCGVGRIRKDAALDNGLSLWVVGDQLWKGAALNAVQISECLLEHGHL